MRPVEAFLGRYGLKLANKFQGGHSDSFFIKKIPGLLDRIPFQNPTQWQFYRAWPKQVLVGLPPEDLDPQDSEGHDHWTEVNTTLAQFRYGRGRLVVSTFDLLKASLDDPVAAILLHDLVGYAASAFEPQTELTDGGLRQAAISAPGSEGARGRKGGSEQ